METNKNSEVLAKEAALENAIEDESEFVRIAFRQGKARLNAILDRLGPTLEKIKESEDRLFQHKNPRWYENWVTYFIFGAAPQFLPYELIGHNISPIAGTFTIALIAFSAAVYFNRLIKLERFRREVDNAQAVYDELEFHWNSLGQDYLIYFKILQNEEKRLLALDFYSQSQECFLFFKNMRLNAERDILFKLTGRISPHVSDWKNSLDASERDFFEKIRS